MMYRIERRKVANVKVTEHTLARFGEMFAAVGLDQWADLCTGSAARARAAAANVAASADELARIRAVLADEIADGTLTPTEAAARLADAERRATVQPVAEGLAADAGRRILRRAKTALYERADEIIGELDAVVRAQADTIRTVASLCVGIDTDAQAVVAEPEHREAWSTATAAVALIHQAHDAARRLRGDGLAPDLMPNPPGRFYRWADPTTLPRTIDGTRDWIDAITSGAEPRVLTVAEVLNLATLGMLTDFGRPRV
jgi:hypothetical protein